MAGRLQLLLTILVLLGTFIGHNVEAKRISRCNKAPIGGNLWDDKATRSCGAELNLYCYSYTAKPYCETIPDETLQAFTECCARQERDNVWTKDIAD